MTAGQETLDRGAVELTGDTDNMDSWTDRQGTVQGTGDMGQGKLGQVQGQMDRRTEMHCIRM